MNRVYEYVRSLPQDEKSKLIDVLISNAPNEVPGIKDFRECLDSDKEDGVSRAHYVFNMKHQYPKINISKLCYEIGVSETTYKKYKSIYGKEWENHYNSNVKTNMLVWAFDTASEKDLNEWKLYHNTTPMDLFFIPESFNPASQSPSSQPLIYN